MSSWQPYPYPSFGFTPDTLPAQWATLHAGDGEPLPDADRVAVLRGRYPEAFDAVAGQSDDDIATALMEAWCAFHNGQFAAAAEAGHALGPLGALVAAKATGIYASRLAPDGEREALLEKEISNIDAAREVMQDEPNAHYFLAFLIGRFSQEISIARALTEGLAGRVRKALDTTLELNPEHAEATTALGVYHAEIVAKVGALVAKLTYGARTDEAIAHGKAALELTPDAPIAWIEYGNILWLLDEDKYGEESLDAYVKAGGFTPADAMQKLDVEYALEQVEED